MNPEKLKACGIDYEEGLHRFSGRAGVYEKYLGKLVGLDIYQDLKEAAAKGDASGAFEACHKMKAFVGNLSISQLYGRIANLTELLRNAEEITEEITTSLESVDLSYQEVVQTIREESEGAKA